MGQKQSFRKTIPFIRLACNRQLEGERKDEGKRGDEGKDGHQGGEDHVHVGHLQKNLQNKFQVAMFISWSWSVLRIRIHRIHMFLGLQDPDPLVRGMDPDPAPDPSIIMQK